MTDATPARPLLRALGALVCLYAPYSWLVLIDYPWTAYRWLWVRMWPILPGLPVHFVPAIHQSPDGAGFLLMGIMTTGILALVVGLALRGGWLSVVTTVVAGLLSIINATIAYALFRA